MTIVNLINRSFLPRSPWFLNLLKPSFSLPWLTITIVYHHGLVLPWGPTVVPDHPEASSTENHSVLHHYLAVHHSEAVPNHLKLVVSTCFNRETYPEPPTSHCFSRFSGLLLSPLFSNRNRSTILAEAGLGQPGKAQATWETYSCCFLFGGSGPWMSMVDDS